jgi:hypothetical protein
MKKLIAFIALFLAAISHASPWAGKIDTSIIPYASAYQSFTDSRQALGFEKRVVSLNYNGNEVAKLGLFGGEASSVGTAPKVIGGPTFALPGSLLDWALGTTWGQQWLPKLKTGVTASYDIVRPSQAHLKPDFYGFGIMYPVGGN